MRRMLIRRLPSRHQNCAGLWRRSSTCLCSLPSHEDILWNKDISFKLATDFFGSTRCCTVLHIDWLKKVTSVCQCAAKTGRYPQVTVEQLEWLKKEPRWWWREGERNRGKTRVNRRAFTQWTTPVLGGAFTQWRALWCCVTVFVSPHHWVIQNQYYTLQNLPTY